MLETGRLALRLCLLLMLSGVAAAGDPPGGYASNTAWGYKVRVPKGWRSAAITTKELWIASKHLGKRELEAAKSNFWAREAPEMWVIGFPHSREVAGERYAGYVEYVKARKGFLDWAEGGYEFTEKEETKVDDVAVTMWEIVAKSGNKDHAPRRVIAWVYHFDDVDFAVQFKILEEHYDGFAGSFRACLKSFRRIKRTSALPGVDPRNERVDTKKLTPEERERHLEAEAERRLQKEIEALPDGWSHKRADGFLVLYNAPEKFVRATAAHAEAVRSHLTDIFGEKGKRYVAPGIVRIFATEGERDAFKAAGEDKTGSEVLVAFGHGYVKDAEYEILNQSILANWMHARHEVLPEVVPGWLSVGLKKYMAMLRTKGKRITFTNEDWDRDSMRLSIKKNEYTDMVNLIGRGLADIAVEVKLESHQREAQERSFGFWILTKGNRGKYKNMVRDYLGALLAGLQSVESAAIRKHEAETAGQKQDPDAASARDWARADVKSKIGAIQRAAFDKLFGAWRPTDWDKLTRAWLGDAK